MSLEVTAVATGSGLGTAAGRWGQLEGRGAAKGQGTWQGTVGRCLPGLARGAAGSAPGPAACALHALVPGAARPQAEEPRTSHEGDLGVPGSRGSLEARGSRLLDEQDVGPQLLGEVHKLLPADEIHAMHRLRGDRPRLPCSVAQAAQAPDSTTSSLPTCTDRPRLLKPLCRVRMP